MASMSLSSLPSPLEEVADLLVAMETPAVSPFFGGATEAAGAKDNGT